MSVLDRFTVRMATERGIDRRGLRASSLRRGRRKLRPLAEDLEGRALLSIGLDPTFGFGGISEQPVPAGNATTSFSRSIDAIALQNGQVVEVGTLNTTNFSGGSFTGSTQSLFVTRLNTDGSVDASFGSGGTATIPISSGGKTQDVRGSDIAVQSNGDIVVLGLASPQGSSGSQSDQWVVARLNPSGGLDGGFGSGGVQLIGFGTTAAPQNSLSATALAIAPSGNIVAVGSTSTSTSQGQVFAVAQLLPNGALDTGFDGDGLVTVNFKVGNPLAESDQANAVAIMSNGSIVVAGSAGLPTAGGSSSFPFPSDYAVARLNTNGSLVTTFNGTGMLTFNDNLGGTPSSDSVNAVTLSSGRIVLVGTAHQVFPSSSSSSNPSVYDLTVARVNPTGQFDTTFNGSGKFLLTLNQAGTTFNTTGETVVARSSGALLIGGTANERSGYSYYGGGGPSGTLFLSLTPTGGLDPSFGTNGAAIVAGSSLSGRMVEQTDGKIDFVTFNGVARTTAPTPAAASTTIITSGAGKKAKATGVTVTFNTAINPALLNNPLLFEVRALKGHKLIKLKKRGGVSYDPVTQTLTLRFNGKTKIKSGFQLVVMTGGVVGMDGQVLPPTPIMIIPVVSSVARR